MEIYLFYKEEWNRMYNCAYKSDLEWAKEGSANVVLGSFYMITGIMYMVSKTGLKSLHFLQVPYIPCLFVMLQPDLIKHSCYKIMFFLGVIDFVTLSLNAVLTGYLTIVGAVYCSYPNLIYVTGSCSMSLWCMACLSCTLLAFNRCVDLWRPKLMSSLFSDNRTYFWLCLPVAYFLYFFLFTQPVLYSSKAYAMFFDPYFEIADVTVDRYQYLNFVHSANNVMVVIVLSILYVFLSTYLWIKLKSSNSTNLGAMQRQIVIQAVVICAFNFMAALIYLYMQFFETSTVFVIVGQIAWQASHGGPAIVYLTLNKTIRKHVFKMVHLGKWSNSTIHVQPASSRRKSVSATTGTQHAASPGQIPTS
ncbi:hypothetical protein L596_020564 [Steinernema carpocapsae]|uniref:G-protein coupled receptors family 1 profile domain-containing protein n=1 Tax=Steinernema carpocapsae TaxID=34508 RepID=A0A4U5MTX3_STECR|nr:hypothetical protein L596_020564 [Steinernema carpocapsae]